VNFVKKLVFVVSLMLITTVCYGQELLTNPGFETGDYSSWTTCGGQSLTSDQFTPVAHSGSYGTQECGCCGQHDPGGGWQEVTAAGPCTVGGWARTCSYGGSNNMYVGHGGTGCPAMDTRLGPPPADCNYYQYTTTLGAGTIQVHYEWESAGWGATCNAADDMTCFQTAVDGWMFY
jgi:hypothetical protein